MQAPTCPFICSDSLLPIVAHCMQKGSSRQIKSSLGSRSCRVWCDLHHFSSTGRDNRHMDSPHTLPPIYVHKNTLPPIYMYARILFHQYMCTPEYSSTNICTIVHSAPKCSSTNMNVPNQSTLPPKYAAKYI